MRFRFFWALFLVCTVLQLQAAHKRRSVKQPPCDEQKLLLCMTFCCGAMGPLVIVEKEKRIPALFVMGHPAKLQIPRKPE